jgi:hypothetical protein
MAEKKIFMMISSTITFKFGNDNAGSSSFGYLKPAFEMKDMA